MYLQNASKNSKCDSLLEFDGQIGPIRQVISEVYFVIFRETIFAGIRSRSITRTWAAVQANFSLQTAQFREINELEQKAVSSFC